MSMTKTDVMAEIDAKITLNGIEAVTGPVLNKVLKDIVDLALPDVKVGIAPAIISQPVSANLVIGNTINLFVGVYGTSPLNYQWRKNGVDITGAITQSLNIDNAQVVNSGSYSCVISNTFGTVTSLNAVINVSAPVVMLTGKCGYLDNLDLLNDEAGLLAALQGSFQYPDQASSITADFRANVVPKWLIVVEDINQPVKHFWYGSENNKGNVGVDDNTDVFVTPTTTTNKRIYHSGSKTQQSETVITLKTTK